jgi:hypothetical protein
MAARGRGSKRITREKRLAISVESRESRKPLTPAELAGAMQDRVHKDVGKARIPRVAKDRK